MPPTPEPKAKSSAVKKPTPKTSFAAAASVVSLLNGMVSKAAKTKEGDDSVVTTMADGIESDVTDWISTGFPHMDAIFGGGWPIGRVSELYGPESSGKSALTHCAVYACQQQGGLPIVVDWEGALDSERMTNNGIAPAGMVYIRPAHIERAWELVWAALDHVAELPEESRPSCVLVVWDSIAASIPKDEAATNATDTNSNFALSKQMARGCRKAFLKAARLHAHFLFVNQERDQIGGGFKSWGGPPKVTPGGKAVKYAATLRIRCVKIETLKEGSKVVGYKIKTTTAKNKCAPPHQTAEWIIDFVRGCGFEVTAWHSLVGVRQIKSSSSVKMEVGGKSRLVKVYSGPWDDDAGPRGDGKLSLDEYHDLYRKSAPFRKGILAVFRAKCMDADQEAAEGSTSGDDE